MYYGDYYDYAQQLYQQTTGTGYNPVQTPVVYYQDQQTGNYRPYQVVQDAYQQTAFDPYTWQQVPDPWQDPQAAWQAYDPYQSAAYAPYVNNYQQEADADYYSPPPVPRRSIEDFEPPGIEPPPPSVPQAQVDPAAEALAKSPRKSPLNTPQKSPQKSPHKDRRKSPPKSPQKSPRRFPLKSPTNSPVKTLAKPLVKGAVKSPVKAVQKSPKGPVSPIRVPGPKVAPKIAQKSPLPAKPIPKLAQKSPPPAKTAPKTAQQSPRPPKAIPKTPRKSPPTGKTGPKGAQKVLPLKPNVYRPKFPKTFQLPEPKNGGHAKSPRGKKPA